MVNYGLKKLWVIMVNYFTLKVKVKRVLVIGNSLKINVYATQDSTKRLSISKITT